MEEECEDKLNKEIHLIINMHRKIIHAHHNHSLFASLLHIAVILAIIFSGVLSQQLRCGGSGSRVEWVINLARP